MSPQSITSLSGSQENLVLSWIKDQAIPIQTLDPQADLDDLAPFQEVVGNASIVGLGEASHAVHEFFVMKHRLLEFLVEQMGFTMFAMEIEWSSAARINEYVLTGAGNAQEILQNTGYHIWKTQEVLHVIEWIRSYNTNPEHVQKVYFAGFDCTSMDGLSLDKIVNFFRLVDPHRVSQVEDLYQTIPRSPLSPRPESNLLQRNIQAAKEVYSLLKEHEQDYSQHSSPQAFAAILQEARIVEQFTQQKAGYAGIQPQDPQFLVPMQQRDHFMAENVAWLHENAPGGAKMVLWAHNWHVGTWGRWCMDPHGAIKPFTWMGMDLRERYQQQYLSVGFSFFEGSLSAWPVDQNGNYLSRNWQSFTIKPAVEECYEALLARAGSLYLLDLRSAPTEEVSKWLDGPRLCRIFDTEYCNDERNFYHNVSLPQWYDVIIHVQKISPSHLLPYTEKDV